jgi:superfamily II DNA/RNA helicase
MQTFCNEPTIVSVKQGETSDNVEQDIVKFMTPDEKFSKLESLLADITPSKVLVFDETQRGVERLSKKLEGSGFAVDAIHGGKSQAQRTRALNRFKKDELSVLVATDVAARGIDVKDITHVINYNTPRTYDDYVHRIGRAGRAGRTGTALTFVQER